MSIIESITNGITKPLSTGIIAASGGAAGGAIESLDNVISYVNYSDETKYTFSSGVLVSSVAATTGIGTETISGTPSYDSSAFGGVGGIKYTTASQVHSQVSSFTPTGSQTLILVVNVPAYSALADICSYATDDGLGQGVARVTYASTGVQWRNTEANSPVSLTAVGASDHIIGIRFNSTTDADYFADSTTTAGSFDPRDDYSTLNRLRFGSRSTINGFTNGTIGALIQTSEALTDEEMAGVISELATNFNITL